MTSIAAPTGSGQPWHLNGSAVYSGTDLKLTGTTASQAGTAIFTGGAVKVDGLTLAFQTEASGGGGADGLSCFLLDPSQETTSSLGGTGGACGFDGLAGGAFKVETYSGSVDRGASWQYSATHGTGPTREQYHSDTTTGGIVNWTLTFTKTAPGKYTVVVTKAGAAYVTWIACDAPDFALLGFGAANGGVTDNHYIRNFTGSTPTVGTFTTGSTSVPLQWSAVASLNYGARVEVPLEWSATTAVQVETSSWVGEDDDRWQVPLEWSAVVFLEPVEEPPPPDVIQRVSVSMPTPTLADGRPVQPWSATQSRTGWGTLQLVIGGRDLSQPRGKPFLALTDAHTEPFGDAEAAFAFPGLTDFDDPADWGLTKLAPVTLRRKDPDGVFHTLYEGDLASVEPDEGQGLVIQCVGVFYRLDLLKMAPALIADRQDYGRMIAAAVNKKRREFDLHIGAMPVVPTGIYGVPPSDFSPFVTGFTQDCLSQMTTDDGRQWTLKVSRPRTPVLVEKDMTTVHATVSYGAPGVAVQLSKDHTTATTAVYGSGTNGHCQWMGARFPNLVQGDAPAFPLSVGSVFTPGGSTTGFAPFAAFLRRGQYGTIVSDDTYDSADVDNVEQFQDRAGITVDGIVGAQTWEAAFQPGANQGSVSGAYVDTIYEKSQTRKRLRNAQGADVGPNPGFDPSVPRIEDYIPFGDNVSKALGRTSAKQIVTRDYPAGSAGQIVLSTDPPERSRFDIYAGMNISVENYEGATVLVHVTRRVRDWQAGTVTLDVDEKARDLLTSAAIYQRNKDVSDLTRRQQFGRKKSKVFDDYGTWLCEDGAGEIPLMNQQGGFWNVQRIAAAPKGTIERISLAFGSGLTEHLLNLNLGSHPPATIPGAAKGAMALFAKPITARAITNLSGMSTPLNQLDSGNSPWDVNEDALNALGKIYAAGGPGHACGFYPNDDPGDGSGTNLSGRFEDAGGVEFGPTGYYWLWVAIWTPVSCLVGGRLFPGAP